MDSFELQGTMGPAADPEQFHRDRLETAAFRIGLLAVFSTFLVPVFLPFVLGSLAVVMSILSRGSSARFSKKGIQAVILGLLAVGINVAYIVYSFKLISSMLADPSGREQISQILYRMYGLTLEEFLSQAGIAH